MIDSHCHLDHEPLFNDLDNVIKRSKAAGVKKLHIACSFRMLLSHERAVPSRSFIPSRHCLPWGRRGAQTGIPNSY